MFFLPPNKRSHTFIIFALSIVITLESYLFSFAQMSPNLRARSNPSPQTSTLVVEPETKPNSESVTQNTEVKKSETQAQTNNSELRIPNSELNKMPVNQQTQVAPVTPQTVASDLNGSIQRLLLLNERKRPSVADCSPFAVLSYCFPYGSQAMVMTGNRDNPLIYAVGAICWNVPCNGKVLFQVSGDRVIARVGQDYQPAPGAFLAMLAFSEIAPNYEIKAGTTSRTLAHLIATEKRNCSRGQNQALTLAGLSFYTPPDEHWRNVLGEDWSLERLVFEELSRRADQSSSDVTNQLLGLSAAVQRYQLDKRPLTGSLASAVTHIQTYQQFALSVQNHDGTWHPNFFVSKGSSPDSDGVLYATAHIMRALVYSLPPERLSDAQIQRGLTALASQLSQRGSAYSQWSEKQLEGTTVGLHALAIYYQKTFGRSAIQKAE